VRGLFPSSCESAGQEFESLPARQSGTHCRSRNLPVLRSVRALPFVATIWNMTRQPKSIRMIVPFQFANAPSERGRRPPVGRAECIVETPYAPEACRERDLRQRHCRVIDQALCELHSTGRRNLAWCCPRMAKKESQEVARPDAQVLCKLADRCPIQKARLDEAHSACDRRRRATPCRAPGRGLRSAPQTWAEAGALRRRSGRKE
jgi:hypothetical protein